MNFTVEILNGTALGLYLPDSPIELVILNSQGQEEFVLEEQPAEPESLEEAKLGKRNRGSSTRNKKSASKPLPKGPSRSARTAMMKAFIRALQKSLKHSFYSFTVSPPSFEPQVKFYSRERDNLFVVTFGQPEKKLETQLMAQNLEASRVYKYLHYFMLLFLKQRDLDDPSRGGVSYFLSHCMVVAYCRYLKLKIKSTRGEKDMQNALLSEYCMRMLEFYGLHFDCSKQKILMDNAGRLQDKFGPDYSFSLICPQLGDRDVGQGAYRVKEVLNCMKNRYFFLTNYNFIPNESVFKYLVNPSKREFDKYI